MFPDDAVEVGRVIGAWGVKGGIRVKPFASDPQALFSCKRWFLKRGDASRPGGARPSGRLPALVRVQQAREHGEAIVATCEGLCDRDAAEQLAGARIFVARSSFPTPASDEYYWVDLIGLQVRNRERQVLGAVVGLIDTGPQCVLRVQPGDAADEEILIPFVAAYVDQVDLAGRCLQVDWQADY